MAIEWWNKIIQVDKSWLTEIQLIPVEIRELNINDFRLVLRTLEAAEEGVVWDYTHNHTAPVSFAGVTIARVVEIVNDYTVTFEDGQYAVNIVGGNSNIGDRVNVNQVSVRSANSAGLITSEGIEALEYGNAVHLDSANGVTGAIYPRGTPRIPVNNLADAIMIAGVRGFSEIHVHGDFTFGATDNIDHFSICGQGHEVTALTFTSGCSTVETVIRNCEVTGTLSGADVHIYDCHIADLSGLDGAVIDSILMGTITLAGTNTVRFINCVDGYAGFGEPTIDMNGSGRGLGIRGWYGGLRLENKSGSDPHDDVSINFSAGRLEIAADVTAGEIVVRGVGQISENLGSAIVADSGLVNVGAVWDVTMADHMIVGTTGKQLYDGGTGGGGDPAAIAAAVWDMVLYPNHVLDDSAGKYLYEFYTALESGDVWLSTSTPTEIMLVRKRLGDAGTLIAETIIDEEAIATNDDTIFTMYQMLFEVNGIWLRDDTGHTGTNYYTGVNGAFDAYTGQITVHTSLPSDNEEVLISYTYYRGLHDEVIDEFLTEGKLYVGKYTGHDYDWTQAFLETPDVETKIAMLAAASLAAARCLEALAASDILQLGFNFRLGDLEIENMVRGGGFQVQAHIDMLKQDVDRWLKILGRSMYFAAGSTRAYGRDAWGYRRKGTAARRSDIR